MIKCAAVVSEGTMIITSSNSSVLKTFSNMKLSLSHWTMHLILKEVTHTHTSVCMYLCWNEYINKIKLPKRKCMNKDTLLSDPFKSLGAQQTV